MQDHRPHHKDMFPSQNHVQDPCPEINRRIVNAFTSKEYFEFFFLIEHHGPKYHS